MRLCVFCGSSDGLDPLYRDTAVSLGDALVRAGIGLVSGFIALPGGLGTLEELFEVWTWGQLGYHPKPVSLLNVGGFYDGLLAFLDQVVARGFVRQEHRAMLVVATTPDALIPRLKTYTPTSLPKWITSGQR